MERFRKPTEPSGSGQQVPAWVLDLLLGVAVTLVLALVISADQGGRRNADALAYGCAAGFGALMLLRRRFPVAVLVATMFLLFAYYTLGYPAIGLAVPVIAALYSAAERGCVPAAVGVSVILVLVSTYYRLRDGEAVAYLLGYELATTATLMAATIALGDGVRTRRALRAEQEHSARLIEQEHAFRAAERIQTERVRMARDLHDVLGHSLSVIALHAAVAGEAIGGDDAQARQAIGHVRTAGSAAMRDLRATVKLLRSPAAEPAASASLAHLTTLIDNTTAGGVELAVEVDGDIGELPATVDTAAYRILQEALTNILRHAAATRVALSIAVDAHAVRLSIADNGAARGAIALGSGIDGMRERARQLGGTLTAQPRAGGGWEVLAVLPLEQTV